MLRMFWARKMHYICAYLVSFRFTCYVWLLKSCFLRRSLVTTQISCILDIVCVCVPLRWNCWIKNILHPFSWACRKDSYSNRFWRFKAISSKFYHQIALLFTVKHSNMQPHLYFFSRAKFELWQTLLLHNLPIVWNPAWEDNLFRQKFGHETKSK